MHHITRFSLFALLVISLFSTGCASTSNSAAQMEYKTVMVQQTVFGAIPNDQIKSLEKQGWIAYQVRGRRSGSDTYTYYWSFRRPKAMNQANAAPAPNQ
jgi:hypothetical protein